MEVETQSEGEIYGRRRAAGIHGREPAFVGRARELATIRDARAQRGCGGVVIVGAPGVGKTRLARAALAEAEAAGAMSVWLRATASAASIPLAAVVDLLPDGAVAGDPLRVFQASTEALLTAAGGRPLVLGVDDAHVLDAGSAALVLHLAGKGVFVVATVRAGTRPEDAVTALWKDEQALRMELDALGEADTVRLVAALLAGPVEGIAANWAYTSSAGNPLYLRELVAGAVDAGALERDATLWRLRRRWPPGPALAELVAQRLEDLGVTRRRLLAAISLGEPLPAAIAAEVGEPEALAALQSRGLVSEEAVDADPVLRLAHPLYGEVARTQTAAAHLDELRIALAGATRARGLRPGDAMRVATWLRDAGAPIESRLLLAAAVEAYRSRDPALAAELAERAARDGGGFEALLALGEALAALGRHDDAERAFAQIRGAPPSPLVAMEYLFARINVLVWGLARSDDARRLVERAAGWWRDDAWRQQTAALQMLVLSASGAVREAAAVADELAAEPQVHPAAAGLLATGGAMAWLHAGHTRKAQAAAERALPAPPADERLGDRELAGLVSWSLTRVESGCEWDAVQVRVARIERAAVRRGDRIAAGPANAVLGRLALLRGTPVTAIRLLREAAGHLELHDPRSMGVVIKAQIAVAAGLLGDAEAARAAEADSRARLGGRAPAWHEAPALGRAAAWTAAARGEPTRAAELLIEQAAAAEALPLWQASFLSDALSLGAPPARVADRLRDAAARCDSRLAAAAARHAAALARADAPQLAGVAADLERIGALLAAAEAAAQAATIYAAESRPAAARRAAALSARLLEHCEGAWTPALRATSTESAGLTRREREIAALAAAGHSNAEIAEQLVLSVRTVESHLYHAMAKVGVAHRGELGAALAAHSGAVSPA